MCPASSTIYPRAQAPARAIVSGTREAVKETFLTGSRLLGHYFVSPAGSGAAATLLAHTHRSPLSAARQAAGQTLPHSCLSVVRYAL